ncbi:ABC transporter permease [Patescibacteria group bacterium]|nr:ABC transporter permease [Patescibacteria group bacterium]
MSYVGLKTLAVKEIKRSLKTPLQVFGAPVITTALYFMIFGYAVGNRVGPIGGISYPEFIMPGLIMMNVLTTAFQSIAFGIMFPRIVGKTINDILVSPMSYLEIAAGFTIASILRSLIVGLLIFATALFFVPLHVDHPIFLIIFTILVAATFSFFGFIIGLWAKSFEQLSIFPTFIIMPLSFLGGVFYSIEMLPPLAQTISKYNPVFYMVNGMRYGVYSVADVSPVFSFGIVITLALIFLAIVWQMLRSGYNLKT